MEHARTRSGLGRGGCLVLASGWGTRERGKLGRKGSGERAVGRGETRMFLNNEIIADQSEQLSWNTCPTCTQKGKRTELVSGKLGCQERPKKRREKMGQVIPSEGFCAVSGHFHSSWARTAWRFALAISVFVSRPTLIFKTFT